MSHVVRLTYAHIILFCLNKPMQFSHFFFFFVLFLLYFDCIMNLK